jgi:RNA polymerase sigma-70 factor (ECF subfamily)
MTHNRSPEREKRDVKLIARMRRGDAAALGALMRDYVDELTSFVLIIVHSMDLAQDAVQNVFIALWDRRATLDITGKVDAYLYRAVRNQALNILRHEKAEHDASDEFSRVYSVGGAVSWNDGETRIAIEEFDAVVQGALDSLQPQVREIYLMHELRGMSNEEIANALEISVLTVRSQMSRALRKIADALGHR